MALETLLLVASVDRFHALKLPNYLWSLLSKHYLISIFVDYVKYSLTFVTLKKRIISNNNNKYFNSFTKSLTVLYKTVFTKLVLMMTTRTTNFSLLRIDCR